MNLPNTSNTSLQASFDSYTGQHRHPAHRRRIASDVRKDLSTFYFSTRERRRWFPSHLYFPCTNARCMQRGTCLGNHGRAGRASQQSSAPVSSSGSVAVEVPGWDRSRRHMPTDCSPPRPGFVHSLNNSHMLLSDMSTRRSMVLHHEPPCRMVLKRHGKTELW